MRTAARLDAHDAFGRQRFRARENELVFFRVDVVGDHINVVSVAETLAQHFDERRLSRADRAADPNAQRAVMARAQAVLRVCAGNHGHERNSLVYCVSCAIEASSTMNAAEPRSSIVASLA